jgi:hypothetical protein
LRNGDAGGRAAIEAESAEPWPCRPASPPSRARAASRLPSLNRDTRITGNGHQPNGAAEPLSGTDPRTSYPVTTAHDFKDFLTVTDRNGEPAIVVGGHAVSLWALHYQDKEPAIRKLAPFTSKDMDFVGDRTTALKLARMVNEPAERAPKSESTPVLYRIKRLFPDRNRQNSTLEVLSHLAGVSRKELRNGTMFIESRELGTKARLPNPITCLKAKVNNLIRLTQEKRQDLKQAKVLVLCCRAYLREIVEQAEAGRLTEGAAAAPCEELLQWSRGRTAHRARIEHRLRFRSAFPVRELRRTDVPSLRRFFRLRLSKAKWL